MSNVINALAFGSIYALVALGYNVIYLTTNVFNFAQGAIVAVCSLLAFTVVSTWGMPVIVALVLCAALGAAIATVEELVAIRPILARSATSHAWLVATVGVSVALAASAQLIWDADAHAVRVGVLDHLVDAGDAYVPVAAFVAIGAALLGTLGLDAWYAFTRSGKTLRATAEDRDAAELRGVNTRGVATASFALGGCLAGIVAVILAPLTYARADLGDLLAIKAFVAMAIGGFGSNRGALIGGVAIGLTEVYSGVWFGEIYSNTCVFALLVAALLLRPRGLFGLPEGRQV